MIVDSSKVSLSEKDIENWLWENPQSVGVEKWVARQFRVPSGIIDLLGVDDYQNPVVVEVKNVELTAAAILQVCRYANDVSRIVQSIGMKINEAYVSKTVVFRGNISNELQYEANAVDVSLRSFQVNYDLKISGRWGWTAETFRRDIEFINDLSKKPEIIDAYLTQDDVNEYMGFTNANDSEDNDGQPSHDNQ